MKTRTPRSQHRQLGFSLLETKNVRIFGGSLLKNSHAKTKRPIHTKKSMHLVLHSALARGSFSLLRHERQISAIIQRQAKRHGVKVYRQANAGNHLHLVILPMSREAFKSFVRAIAGLISRLVLGAERGRGKGLRFWSQRPFTRIVEWGRDFKRVSYYLARNTFEAIGFVNYKPRHRRRPPAEADIFDLGLDRLLQLRV